MSVACGSGETPEIELDPDAGHLDTGDTDTDEQDTDEQDTDEQDTDHSDTDDVEVNACGGTETLDEEPGTSCGPCDDGLWTCDGTDNVVCDGASELNLCDGCAELTETPGESCILDSDATPGDAATCTVNSDCSDSFVCIDGICIEGDNAGVWECDGPDDLVCSAGEPLNLCGGEEELDGAPGDECEDCGFLECDGTNDLICVDTTDVMTDPLNCGDCGVACAVDEYCDGGDCISVHATCDDTDPPTRCSDDPTTFDWEPASIFTALAMADSDCCFDFTGDGSNDNQMHDILDAAGTVDSFNDQVATAIDNGELIYVLEHDGIDDLVDSDDYILNFLKGSSATDTEVVIDAGSLDQGTHPLWFFPQARVTSGQLSAEMGTVFVPYEFFVPVELPVRSAILQGTVVASGQNLEDGVTIEAGTLGGIILLEDFLGSLNDIAKDCDCLGEPDPLLVFDPADSTASCTMDKDPSTQDDCINAGEAHCADLLEVCDMVSVVPLMADIDTNGSGDPDAMSIGMTFEADPIVIDGIE